MDNFQLLLNGSFFFRVNIVCMLQKVGFMYRLFINNNLNLILQHFIYDFRLLRTQNRGHDEWMPPSGGLRELLHFEGLKATVAQNPQ